MDSEYPTTTPFAEFNRRTFFGILLIAGISALITLLLAKGLNQFIVAPALCEKALQASCTSSASVSFHISSLIASIAAVAMMVNLSVYRPLLVVIATLIGTWGMYNLPFPLIGSPWYWQLAVIFFINAVAYLTFAWILRAYNLIAGLALTLFITILMILAISL